MIENTTNVATRYFTSITKVVSISLTLALLASCTSSVVTVSSPDGNLNFHLSVSEGQSVISIEYKGETLLFDSPIGMEFEDGYFGGDVNVTAGKPVMTVDDYDMPVGKTSHVHSISNELVATLRNAGGRQVRIYMRAFDDGVAYRYEIPEQKSMQSLAVKAERMELKFAGDPVTKAMILPGFISSHEANYRTAPLSSYEDGLLMDMPVFLEFPSGKYMSVTEANVVDYAGMMIASKDGMLTGTLSPRLDGTGLSVIGNLPHRSPWRVFMVSDRAGAFLESNILTTLCDPCQEKDLSWLNPGKSTWPWWCGYQAPAEMKKGDINTINCNINTYFIDFCAKYGIPYHSITGIIDENDREYCWYYNEGSSPGSPKDSDDARRLYPGFEIEPISRYAAEKGVGMRVWVHWKTLAKDIEGTYRQFSEWGVKGMMIDFMDRDDQEMIEFQKKALELGMKYHLHIQFHGSSKPSGLQRTYPCEFTRENTLNYEVYKWNGRQLGADHDLDLPFTRCIAGPTDYHLGGFRAVTLDEYEPVHLRPVVTCTRSHMLAMYVVYESALHLVSDTPSAYEGEEGFDFIRQVPTIWDETRVLVAEPGECILVARRSGRDWYLGAIGNSKSKHEFAFDADFLDEGEYTMTLYHDAADSESHPNSIRCSESTVKTSDHLNVNCVPSGGFAAIIKHRQ